MKRSRVFTHAGSIECAAVLVSESALGRDAARRRVLAAWEPGATVHEATVVESGKRRSAGFLVRFAKPRRALAETAPGTPFVRYAGPRGEVVSAVPLTADELAAAPQGVSWARGGVVEVLELAAAPTDVSAWIDLAGWSDEEVRSLGAPLPPLPRVRMAAPEVVAARAVFGDTVPAQDPQVEALLQAMREQRAAKASGSPYRDPGRPLAAAIEARLVRAVALVTSLLSRPGASRAGDDARAPAGDGSTRRGIVSTPSEPLGGGAAVSRTARWIARISAWIARRLVAMGIAESVERRHDAYLARLLEMLDGDDLDEALRHAIQLGKEGDADGDVPLALGELRPRPNLNVSATSRPASTSLASSGGSVFETLKKKYRAAFERLEKAGEIEKAAFVLAELLHEDLEAVAFLERHGRFRLAAELAEGRKLPPGLVVRAWILAGEPARALVIARARGAFADAVTRMEAGEEGVRALAPRLAWAEHLAKAGDFAGAVDVAHGRPGVAAREVVDPWIDAAMAQGGASRARVLPLRIADDSSEATQRALQDLLSRDDLEAHRERLIFARALLARPSFTPFARAAARATVRALHRDAERFDAGALQGIVDGLVKFAEDAGLVADRAPFRQKRRVSRAALVYGADDRGLRPVLDAALLAHRQTIVALGSGGVLVLGRDGRPLQRFDLPADRLVVSDRADRFITLSACGGGVHRLGRIDLASGRAEPWCEARISAFARDFDGAQWLVGVGSKILAIDAGGDGFEAIYAAPGGGDVRAIARDAAGCHALVSEEFGEGLEARRYDLDWTLRARTPREALAEHRTARAAIGGGGGVATVELGGPDGGGVVVRINGASARPHATPMRRDGETPLALDACEGFVAGVMVGVDGVRIEVTAIPTLGEAGEVRLLGAADGGVRVTPGAIVAWDDLGRIVAFDLESGELLRDARV